MAYNTNTARKVYNSSEYDYYPSKAPYRPNKVDVRQKNTVKQRRREEFSRKETQWIIKNIIKVVIFVMALVLISALESAVVYNNKNLKEENLAIQGEVEFLELQLSEKITTEKIEEYAINTLGMVYPGSDQEVVLGEEKEKVIAESKGDSSTY